MGCFSVRALEAACKDHPITVKKAVSEAETGVDLVNAWAAHTDALNALKEAHPDKHDELDSFYVGREAKLQREGEQQSTEAAE